MEPTSPAPAGLRLRPCPACSGTGLCPHCEAGRVEVDIPYSGMHRDDGPDTGRRLCVECDGNAACVACAGTGHDEEWCACGGGEEDNPYCAAHAARS